MPECRAAHLAVRRAALDPAGAPRAALAEFAGNLEKPMMQRQPHHDDVFGDRGFMPERVADATPRRQRGEVEQSTPVATDCTSRTFGRRRVVGAPVVADKDVGVGRGLGRARQLAAGRRGSRHRARPAARPGCRPRYRPRHCRETAPSWHTVCCGEEILAHRDAEPGPVGHRRSCRPRPGSFPRRGRAAAGWRRANIRR